MTIETLRETYHLQICREIVYLDSKGIPNNADKNSNASKAIARGVFERITCNTPQKSQISGQKAGRLFEKINQAFLQAAFSLLNHLRPGQWIFNVTGDISKFEQYRHLAELTFVLQKNPELKTSLGTDYFITPDIIIAKSPTSDARINQKEFVISEQMNLARLTPFRASNNLFKTMFLHASVSVKWTLRSDRAQNARTEALNLIRNRKGHTPHIVAITAEPTPGRIASLALGTGDIDCIYHFALYELIDAVNDLGHDETSDLLMSMVNGNRLRDISDLPFDLVI